MGLLKLFVLCNKLIPIRVLLHMHPHRTASLICLGLVLAGYEMPLINYLNDLNSRLIVTYSGLYM